MRIRKLIWILVGCCLLSGCRSGNANLNEKNVSDTEVTEESAESRKETEQDFPQRIQEDVSENVHIDAECVYPENFQEGKGLKAVQSGSTLWEQREQIVDKFAKGNPVLDVEETSYDDFQSESYTLTETTGISITSENVLNYFSDQATYGASQYPAITGSIPPVTAPPQPVAVYNGTQKPISFAIFCKVRICCSPASPV